MTGVLFKPVPVPHAHRVIKQTDDTQSSPPVFTHSDSELVATLHPNKLYEIRGGFYLVGGASGSNFMRLSPSAAVDMAYLVVAGQRTNQADGWASGSNDPWNTYHYDTAAFNLDTKNFACGGGSGSELTTMYGILATGAAAVTITVKFGTASVNAQAFTLKAGSWLYVREQVQV